MKRALLISIIFSTSIMSAMAQQRLTLAESIDIAIKNNLEIALRNVAVDVATVNQKQAKQNLLPTVNGNVTHGLNQGRSIDPFSNTFVNQKINYASYSFGTDVVVFNGFALRNAIRQNMFAHDAAKLDVQQSRDNLTLAVILAYLQVLSNEEQLEVARKQVAVTQVQLDRLEKLNNQGAISPPLMYDMRGQLKEAELNVIDAQNAIASSKLALSQLMTIPYNPNLQVEKISGEELLQKFPSTAEEVYKSSMEKLGVIKAGEARQKLAEATIRYTRSLLYPTLSLFGRVNTNYSSAAAQDVFTNITEEPTSSYVVINGNKQPVFVSRRNFEAQKITYTNQLKNNIFYNFGVSLRLPIFNSFAAKNRIRIATLQHKDAGLQLENLKVQLRQEIEQAFLNMNNAFERHRIIADQVTAYAESFRAAEVRFNAGVGTSVDYMIAKDNLDRASINLVAARYDYLLRKKILEFYSNR
jgi:outer membrane protein